MELTRLKSYVDNSSGSSGADRVEFNVIAVFLI